MTGTNYDALKREAEALARQLADPSLSSQPTELAKAAKRQKQVEEQLALHEAATDHRAHIGELEKLTVTESDETLLKMAHDELAERKIALRETEAALDRLQHPADPSLEKNAIVEIRAGAGGDEASLFARDLYGMYQKYAEARGWKVELLSTSRSDAGGFKEVIFSVSGEGAYGALRFEGGAHRVQRIPVTESGGRIHTSTATVAVLPEAEEQEVEISPEEIRVDVFRSSGPGGQSVNTTDSAVRITHLPTGLVVSCQDEKSQHKNRAKAMAILRARLRAKQQDEAATARGDTRRKQVGTGDRSEKIRTYNFPQDRLTDHRIGYSRHGLEKVLAGDLQPVIDALQEAASSSDAE